jgi:hypothetical protein
MSVSYYVYYRVSPARHDAARQAVAAMFLNLHETQGIVGRLACRRDDPDTWMEIYEGVGDEVAFGNALEQAARHCAIDACLQSGAARKTEIFMPLNMDRSTASRSAAE